MNYYDLEKDLNVEFKQDNLSDLFYHQAIGAQIHPEQRKSYDFSHDNIITQQFTGASEGLVKPLVRTTFGLAGGLMTFINQQAEYMKNRPLGMYAAFVGDGFERGNDESVQVQRPGMEAASSGVVGHFADTIKRIWNDTDFDPLDPNEMNDAQRLLGAIETHSKTVADWFTERQKSTKIMGLEIAAADPDIFRGDFMDNPSYTRAIAAVTAAIPSLGAVVGSTILTGSPMPAIALLGAITAGQTTQEAREAGASIAASQTYGIVAGISEMVMESFGFEALGLGELTKKPAAGIFKKFLKMTPGARRAARSALGVVTEGLEEGSQQFVQNLIAKIGYEHTRNLFEGVVESIIGGAGTGGVVGMVMPDSAAKFDKAIEVFKKNGGTDAEVNRIYDEVSAYLGKEGGPIDEALSKFLDTLKQPAMKDRYADMSNLEKLLGDIDMKQEFDTLAKKYGYKEINDPETLAKQERAPEVDDYTTNELNIVLNQFRKSEKNLQSSMNELEEQLKNGEISEKEFYSKKEQFYQQTHGQDKAAVAEFVDKLSDDQVRSLYEQEARGPLNYSIEDARNILKEHFLNKGIYGAFYWAPNTIMINRISIEKFKNEWIKNDNDPTKVIPSILKGSHFLGVKPKAYYDYMSNPDTMNAHLINHEIAHKIMQAIHGHRRLPYAKFSDSARVKFTGVEEMLVEYYAYKKTGGIDIDSMISKSARNKMNKYWATVRDIMSKRVEDLGTEAFGSKEAIDPSMVDQASFAQSEDIVEMMDSLNRELSPYETIEDKWLRELDITKYENYLKMKDLDNKLKDFAKRSGLSRSYVGEMITYLVEFEGVKENPLDQMTRVKVDEQNETFQEVTVREAIKMNYDPKFADTIISKIEKNWEEAQRIFNEQDPEFISLAKEFSDIYNLYGDELLAKGFIEGKKKNYTSREYIYSDLAKQPSNSKGSNTSKHFQKKMFENHVIAIAQGYMPKSIDIVENLSQYVFEVSEAVSNIKFLNSLKKLDNNGLPFISDRQLPGYEKLESNLFNESVKMKDGSYVNAPMYAPKQQAKAINSMLGKSKLEGNKWIDSLSVLNANLKSTRLLSSLFHHMAFFNSYVFGVQGKYKHGLRALNPFAAYKEGLAMIDQGDELIKLGFANGLTHGLQQDWDKKKLQEKTWLGKVLDRNDVTKEVKNSILKMRDTYTDFLFGQWGAGLKAMSFKIEYLHYRANPKFANLSNDQVAEYVAKFVNDDFGGLHHKRMHRNPTTQHVLRLLLLGADWTESNVRTIIKAFKAGREGDIYRRFWGGAAIKIAMVTTIMNMAMAMIGRDDEDKDTFEELLDQYATAWENGKLNTLKVHIDPMFELFGYKTNNEHYLNVGGHFLDPVKWVTRDMKKGGTLGEATADFFDPNRLFNGLAKTAYYKSSMVAKPIVDLMKGTDYTFYRKFTDLDKLIGKTPIDTSKSGNTRTLEWIKWKEKAKMVSPSQIPSFIAYQSYQLLPVFIVNMIEFLFGEATAIEAIPRTLGFDVSRTYNKEYKKKPMKNISIAPDKLGIEIINRINKFNNKQGDKK